MDELIPNVSLPEGSSGPWRIERFAVTEDEARFENMRAVFSRSSRTIKPGTYTRLKRGGTVVMSDTPAEKMDHWQFVRRAKGKVLVHGLGLGMVAVACARKPEVESVTALEVSPDVIALVSPHMPEKVTVIEGDAFTYQWPRGTYFDAVWHDIWDAICADNLPEMHKLHRRFARRSGYQASWCRSLCERYA